MHERALVSRAAVNLLSLAGGDRVGRVTLAVGPETDPEVVEQAWLSATRGTSAADAELCCVMRRHGMQCLDCGGTYEGGKLSPCPACGGNGLIVDPAAEVAIEAWSKLEPV